MSLIGLVKKKKYYLASEKVAISYNSSKIYDKTDEDVELVSARLIPGTPFDESATLKLRNKAGDVIMEEGFLRLNTTRTTERELDPYYEFESGNDQIDVDINNATQGTAIIYLTIRRTLQ